MSRKAWRRRDSLPHSVAGGFFLHGVRNRLLAEPEQFCGQFFESRSSIDSACLFNALCYTTFWHLRVGTHVFFSLGMNGLLSGLHCMPYSWVALGALCEEGYQRMGSPSAVPPDFYLTTFLTPPYSQLFVPILNIFNPISTPPCRNPHVDQGSFDLLGYRSALIKRLWSWDVFEASFSVRQTVKRAIVGDGERTVRKQLPCR